MPSSDTDPRDQFFDVSDLSQHAGRRAGRASIVVLLNSILKFVLHLGSTIVLARLVPPAEYGIAALALPVAAIVINLAQLGLAQPIVQMKTINHAMVSTLFWAVLALGMAFGGIMAACSGLAARFYGVPEVGPVFVLLGVTVVFSSILSLYVSILRRKMQINILEYGALAAFALSIFLAVIAALLGASYWAVILQQFLQAFLSVVIYAFFVHWRPSSPLKADFAAARGALSFGGNIAIASLLQQISVALPVMLIGRQYSPYEAGLFQRSNTLARMAPGRVVSPLASVFISTLSRLQDDGPEFRTMMKRMVTRLDMIMMPIGVMAFTTSDLLVPAVLGPEWAPAAPILAWLSIIMLQNTMDQGMNWALVACGASKEIKYYSMLMLVMIIAMLWLVGFDGGVLRIAIAWMVINQFLRQPLLLWFTVRKTHFTVRTYLTSYILDLGVAISAIAAVLGARALMSESGELLQFFAAGAITVAIFGVRGILDPGLRHDIVKTLGFALRPKRG